MDGVSDDRHGDQDGALFLDALAEEFIERLRGGEAPTVEEYAERHPDIAGEIQELFPTLQAIEDLGAQNSGTPATRPAAPPRRLGEYRILREIGRGGMGVVYEAEQEALGRRVALKVLPYHALMDASPLERFRREATAAAGLQHPNIVPVFAVGEDEGVHYFVMQLLDARPLDQVIEDVRRLRSEGQSSAKLPLPGRGSQTESDSEYFRSVARIGVQVADALSYAHGEGVLHRDVKPGNLLLDSRSTVWVTDFGLAKTVGSDDLTQTGDQVGTLAYMAPERFRGWADPTSDVYGLGLTLYELLTLRRAFRSPNRHGLMKQVMETEPRRPRRIDPRIPRDLETIVTKSIAKSSAARYPSASALSADLGRFLRGETIQARPSGIVTRTAKWARRRPFAAALVFVLIASTIAIATGAFVHNSRMNVALAGARAEALVRASGEAEARDPMLSLLLARAAARERLGPDVVTRLHRAVLASLERRNLEPGHLTGHWRPLFRAAWSPTGNHILTAAEGGDKAIRISSAVGEPVAELDAHGGYLNSAAFSPDGALVIATEGRSNAANPFVARLWSVGGERLAVFIGHSKQVVSGAVSPDGRRVVTASDDRTARLWTVEGDAIAVLEGHRAKVRIATFSPSGDLVLTASRDHTARLFTPAGDAVAVLEGHGGPLTVALFSPAGDRILTAAEDGSLRIWTRRGESLSAARHGESGVAIRAAAWSPEGDRFATASGDGTLQLWRADGTPITRIAGHDEAVLSVAFSPEGRRILSASADRTARIFDRNGRLLEVLRGHRATVAHATFSPDGKRVVTGSRDWSARIWSVVRTEVATLAGHAGPIRFAGFSADGESIVTTSDDRTARVFDREGVEVAVLTGHEGAVGTAAFDPSGDRLVTGSRDGTARVWDRDGTARAVLRGHAASVDTVLFSRDGERVLTGSSDGTARVWNLRGEEIACVRIPERRDWHERGARPGILVMSPTRDAFLFLNQALGQEKALRNQGVPVRLWSFGGEELALFGKDQGWIASAGFSADGNRIITGGWDNTARLWSKAGDELVVFRGERHQGHEDAVTGAALSPSGAHVLTTSLDGTARLWDRSGRELKILAGHGDPVTVGAYSPSGGRILTASRDGTARLWTKDGEPIGTLAGHVGPITAACFSPCGRLVLTASEDGYARLWYVRTRDLLDLVDRRITRELTAEERLEYGLPEDGESR